MTDRLRAGAARRDITPANGGQFFGYARPDKLADGVAIRLFAHALVLDDGDRRIALVSADLGAPKVREQVLEHVGQLGFGRDSLLFACTHTHAGPNDIGEWIAARIGQAVAEAVDRLRPAAAGWGSASVPDANRSRSVEAHLANHGQDHQPGTATVDLDPKGPDHPRDTILRLLRVDDAAGDPLAAWTQFPVHPTAYTPHNTTFSADLAGVAVRRFVDDFPRDTAPVALYASGALGDLIPVYDEYNQHAVADRSGTRIARGMRAAWSKAGEDLSETIPVAGRTRTVTYEGQTVGDGKEVADEAVFGLPFFGGGQNGPSLFFDAGLEGLRLPAEEADPVHGRKLVVDTAPWSSSLEAQAVRVGDRLLLGYPGEPTTETARRVRAAVADVAADGVTDVAVLAVVNGYHGYFTTPEEYDQQHYEGGHTVFGKYTALPMEAAHVELAQRLSGGDERSATGETRAPAAGDAAEESPDPEPPVGQTYTDATLLAGPPDTVQRMEVARVTWRGSNDGRDRPVDDPFIVLERAEEGWMTVATDLEFGLVWRETEAGYVARYDVPPDLPTGTYRFRIAGTGYELETDPFEVTVSTRLGLRGIETDTTGEDIRLIVRAQNPPPDPERNLRARSPQPTGGEVRLDVEDRTLVATWDPEYEGWTTTVADGHPGEKITVPPGGLVDGHDNRSGAGLSLTVGKVHGIDWPPPIGSGGERPPAPRDVQELLEAVLDLLE